MVKDQMWERVGFQPVGWILKSTSEQVFSCNLATFSFKHFGTLLVKVKEKQAKLLSFSFKYFHFVVYLPGFKTDQLKIQIDRHGTLKVTGERHLADNKWSHFHKEFLTPKYCNENEIRAKFSNGVLYITIPRPITKVASKDEAMPKQQGTPNQETEMGQKSDKVNGGVTGQQQEKKTEDAKKEMNGIDGKLAGEEGAESGGKMIGSKENQVVDPQKQRSSSRLGLGMSFRFKQPRRAIVNITVAIAVVVALGVYAKYRLHHSAEYETLEANLAL
ncbi:uncharacterized protein LOC122086818 [Macadamia integrifolia]|uniref:uncharacterized protein LOC122086818 n=1 Tax=Macadamia integrifolia TaxID=60698 RepID=UPI001C4F10F9|nr:uncharacterized protein LOC122086818 [Macadamia integrifolia]